MKRIACIALSVASSLHALVPTPYLAFRSQSERAARELVGLVPHINKPVDYSYATFAFTPEYTQSYHQNRIADCLFGNDLLTDTLSAINITGTQVAERNAQKDWLADYFGLPRDFSSTVRFEPIVSNIMCDMYCYAGLNHILYGLFATVHAPIVRTKWDLNYFEVINQPGVLNMPAGYFNDGARVETVGFQTENIGVKRADLLKNFEDFVFKKKVPNLGEHVSFCPLEHARMTPKAFNCNKTKTGLSDIQVVVGYNPVMTRWCHYGGGLRFVIPTGNRPDSTYLFAPMIGNGKHWELGVQLWEHYTFYVSENEERTWTAYVLANIMHMFSTKQCRTFDLCSKPNSRWMLAEQLTQDVSNLQSSTMPNDVTILNTPNAQFANKFTPVANLTTRRVKVSANLQIDAVGMLTYQKRNLTFDFGYNVWFRSCEKITPDASCTNTPLTDQLWALKGDAHIYGFTKPNTPGIPDNTPVALSATQSNATIHAGTNVTTTIDGMEVMPDRNPVIDNRQWAVATFNGNSAILNKGTINPLVEQQTNTSTDPIVICEHAVDMHSARTRGISHTIFFHLSHQFVSLHRCIIPFFGFGMNLEFGNRNVKQTESSSSCQNCALSQIGIWLKGGWSY